MEPVDQRIKHDLDKSLREIGEKLNANPVTIISPIIYRLDSVLKNVLDQFKSSKKDSLVVIIETPGGLAEIVERMVVSIRYSYDELIVIIPDKAMSAGTIFALSADRILMNYFSALGPIDPQIEKDGKLVPALSYLIQYERLNEKARNSELTTAEYALLQKLDLGELYQFEQARELSRELLIKWLSQYKFKNWHVTESKKKHVTKEMKENRAREIADILNDPQRWHSHARSIHMETLTNEIGLKIEDYAGIENLEKLLQSYMSLLRDYMLREKLPFFIHAEEFFNYEHN